MAALGSLVRAGVMRSRECFQRLMERKGCLPVAEAFPSTCLSIVAVENDSLACWTLGDSLIAVLLNDGQLQLLRDDRVERFDVAVTVKFATALKQGTPPDEARKLVEPELLANRQRRNRTDGYFILADDLDAVSQAKMFHLPLSSVAKVFLCTDGLLQAVAPFGLFPNNEALCREILNGDAQTLSNLGERLEIAAGQDPNCVKYPRLKIIDDMAAISCAVTTTA
jgi:serine/threonine protein phosphatase PrpC